MQGARLYLYMRIKIKAWVALCVAKQYVLYNVVSSEEHRTYIPAALTHKHSGPYISYTYKIHSCFAHFLVCHMPNGVSSLLVRNIPSPVENIAVGLWVCISAVNLACRWKLWQIILRTIALCLGSQLAVLWDSLWLLWMDEACWSSCQ